MKAVFLYSFSQFVKWPPTQWVDPQAPFVIGILGKDPFGSALDEAVQGERVNGHELVVRRFRALRDIQSCQILFISRPEADHLGQILSALRDQAVLTVGDSPGFAEHGGMVYLVTENNRIRFQINLEAARAGRLTISSKLLQLARIVRTEKE